MQPIDLNDVHSAKGSLVRQIEQNLMLEGETLLAIIGKQV